MDSARVARRDRAHVNDHEAVVCSLQHTVRAQDNLAHLRAVRQHGDQEVDLRGDVSRGVSKSGARIRQLRGSGTAPTDYQFMTSPGQVEGHGAAHDAEADESDAHVGPVLPASQLGVALTVEA